MSFIPKRSIKKNVSLVYYLIYRANYLSCRVAYHHYKFITFMGSSASRPDHSTPANVAFDETLHCKLDAPPPKIPTLPINPQSEIKTGIGKDLSLSRGIPFGSVGVTTTAVRRPMEISSESAAHSIPSIPLSLLSRQETKKKRRAQDPTEPRAWEDAAQITDTLTSATRPPLTPDSPTPHLNAPPPTALPSPPYPSSPCDTLYALLAALDALDHGTLSQIGPSRRLPPLLSPLSRSYDTSPQQHPETSLPSEDTTRTFSHPLPYLPPHDPTLPLPHPSLPLHHNPHHHHDDDDNHSHHNPHNEGPSHHSSPDEDTPHHSSPNDHNSSHPISHNHDGPHHSPHNPRMMINNDEGHSHHTRHNHNDTPHPCSLKDEHHINHHSAHNSMRMMNHSNHNPNDSSPDSPSSLLSLSHTLRRDLTAALQQCKGSSGRSGSHPPPRARDKLNTLLLGRRFRELAGVAAMVAGAREREQRVQQEGQQRKEGRKEPTPIRGASADRAALRDPKVVERKVQWESARGRVSSGPGVSSVLLHGEEEGNGGIKAGVVEDGGRAVLNGEEHAGYLNAMRPTERDLLQHYLAEGNMEETLKLLEAMTRDRVVCGVEHLAGDPGEGVGKPFRTLSKGKAEDFLPSEMLPIGSHAVSASRVDYTRDNTAKCVPTPLEKSLAQISQRFRRPCFEDFVDALPKDFLSLAPSRVLKTATRFDARDLDTDDDQDDAENRSSTNAKEGSVIDKKAQISRIKDTKINDPTSSSADAALQKANEEYARKKQEDYRMFATKKVRDEHGMVRAARGPFPPPCLADHTQDPLAEGRARRSLRGKHTPEEDEETGSNGALTEEEERLQSEDHKSGHSSGSIETQTTGTSEKTDTKGEAAAQLNKAAPLPDVIEPDWRSVMEALSSETLRKVLEVLRPHPTKAQQQQQKKSPSATVAQLIFRLGVEKVIHAMEKQRLLEPLLRPKGTKSCLASRLESDFIPTMEEYPEIRKGIALALLLSQDIHTNANTQDLYERTVVSGLRAGLGSLRPRLLKKVVTEIAAYCKNKYATTDTSSQSSTRAFAPQNGEDPSNLSVDKQVEFVVWSVVPGERVRHKKERLASRRRKRGVGFFLEHAASVFHTGRVCFRLSRVSSLRKNPYRHYSPDFQYGGVPWSLLAMQHKDHLALYLCQTGNVHCKFILTLLHVNEGESIRNEGCQRFQSNSAENDWGFNNVVSLEKLFDPVGGFWDSETDSILVDIALMILDDPVPSPSLKSTVHPDLAPKLTTASQQSAINVGRTTLAPKEALDYTSHEDVFIKDVVSKSVLGSPTLDAKLGPENDLVTKTTTNITRRSVDFSKSKFTSNSVSIRFTGEATPSFTNESSTSELLQTAQANASLLELVEEELAGKEKKWKKKTTRHFKALRSKLYRDQEKERKSFSKDEEEARQKLYDAEKKSLGITKENTVKSKRASKASTFQQSSPEPATKQILVSFNDYGDKSLSCEIKEIQEATSAVRAETAKLTEDLSQLLSEKSTTERKITDIVSQERQTRQKLKLMRSKVARKQAILDDYSVTLRDLENSISHVRAQKESATGETKTKESKRAEPQLLNASTGKALHDTTIEKQDDSSTLSYSRSKSPRSPVPSTPPLLSRSSNKSKRGIKTGETRELRHSETSKKPLTSPGGDEKNGLSLEAESLLHSSGLPDNIAKDAPPLRDVLPTSTFHSPHVTPHTTLSPSALHKTPPGALPPPFPLVAPPLTIHPSQSLPFPSCSSTHEPPPYAPPHISPHPSTRSSPQRPPLPPSLPYPSQALPFPDPSLPHPSSSTLPFLPFPPPTPYGARSHLPYQEIPSPQGVLSQRASPQRVSPQGVPSERAPPQGVPSERVPPQAVPSERVYPQGIPSERVPSQGIPSERVYPQGIPASTTTNMYRIPNANTTPSLPQQQQQQQQPMELPLPPPPPPQTGTFPPPPLYPPHESSSSSTLPSPFPMTPAFPGPMGPHGPPGHGPLPPLQPPPVPPNAYTHVLPTRGGWEKGESGRKERKWETLMNPMALPHPMGPPPTTTTATTTTMSSVAFPFPLPHPHGATLPLGHRREMHEASPMFHESSPHFYEGLTLQTPFIPSTTGGSNPTSPQGVKDYPAAWGESGFSSSGRPALPEPQLNHAKGKNKIRQRLSGVHPSKETFLSFPMTPEVGLGNVYNPLGSSYAPVASSVGKKENRAGRVGSLPKMKGGFIPEVTGTGMPSLEKQSVHPGWDSHPLGEAEQGVNFVPYSTNVLGSNSSHFTQGMGRPLRDSSQIRGGSLPGAFEHFQRQPPSGNTFEENFMLGYSSSPGSYVGSGASPTTLDPFSISFPTEENSEQDEPLNAGEELNPSEYVDAARDASKVLSALKMATLQQDQNNQNGKGIRELGKGSVQPESGAFEHFEPSLSLGELEESGWSPTFSQQGRTADPSLVSILENWSRAQNESTE